MSVQKVSHVGLEELSRLAVRINLKVEQKCAVTRIKKQIYSVLLRDYSRVIHSLPVTTMEFGEG